MSCHVFTGLKPTGRLQAGNYFGAVRPLVELGVREDHRLTLCVADLHALTVTHRPEVVQALTFDVAATLVACAGDTPVDVFVQSTLGSHTELAYLLECVAGHGELARMIQFKQRAVRREPTRVSLFTYPVLMAADVLAHQADVVPVGDDQRQHLELTVTLAERFNRLYGPVFRVPRGVGLGAGIKVRDLRDPTAKMGKSATDTAGVVFVCDPPDVIAAKVRGAVTDSERMLSFDPERRPGIANLAVLLAACRWCEPACVFDGLDGAGALKAAVIDALVAEFAPIRARYLDLVDDRAALTALLRAGRDRVAPAAAATVAAARSAFGLVDV